MKQFAFVFLALSLVACSHKREDIIGVSSDDAEMNAAIAQAQHTLPDFWKRREKEGDQFLGLLKVYFTDPGSGKDGEHMWVGVTDRGANEVSGVLLDDPGWVKSVKQGDQVRFSVTRITDWLLVENGKAQGAFRFGCCAKG
jgi:uncharacterized protein YegJ (DUF2314 family)